jgi:hypothetical protein
VDGGYLCKVTVSCLKCDVSLALIVAPYRTETTNPARALKWRRREALRGGNKLRWHGGTAAVVGEAATWCETAPWEGGAVDGMPGSAANRCPNIKPRTVEVKEQSSGARPMRT